MAKMKVQGVIDETNLEVVAKKKGPNSMEAIILKEAHRRRSNGEVIRIFRVGASYVGVAQPPETANKTA